MPRKLRTKVLIIGGGAAGMSAALNLETKEVILVEMPSSNSILSPWNLMLKDPRQMQKNMLKVGNGMNEKSVLKKYIENFLQTEKDFLKFGIKLKKSNIGMVPDYRLAGLEVKNILSKKIKKKKVKVIKGRVTSFLLDKNKKIQGAGVDFLAGGKGEIVAEHIILAAGGAASFFKYATGEKNATGNVLALAYEGGLELTNLEFLMFHPFLIVDKKFPRVLVSGSILSQMDFCDEKGKKFLTKKIEKALKNNEHHGVFSEMNKEFYSQSLKGKIFAKLNCSEAWFEKYKKENEFGFIFSQYSKTQVGKIEIHPAQHFLIGGIKINEKAQTSQNNVFAAGEIAGGLHGSDRIGGTAIHEAWIFGKIAAKEINRVLKNKNKLKKLDVKSKIGKLGISSDIKEKTWRTFGPIKTLRGLSELVSLIDQKGEKVSSEEKIIRKIAEVCLRRKESVGAFFRKDLPMKKKALNSFIQKGGIIFK